MEQVVKPKSLGGFIQSLSGLFITKDNPAGLTPKEMHILTVLVFILQKKGTRVVDKAIKEELGNVTNHSFQVITNYIARLRNKGVIQGDTLHPLFNMTKITIAYGENAM